MSRHALFFGRFLGVLTGAVALSTVGCEPSGASSDALRPAVELTILTPHSPAVTNAFSVGFSRWYYNKHKKSPTLRFIQRGTPQCVEYLIEAFGSANQAAGSVPEIMFGGGVADHALLKGRNFSRKVDVGSAFDGVPAEIAGYPTRDAEGYWYATGLSSFGILYNARACAERGIAAPKTWSDLGDSRFSGWIGFADPGASGSTRESLLLILQHAGWEPGWTLITQILANARGISANSGDVLDGVEAGVFLAAFAVNFDGMRRAAASGGAVEFVNPVGATAASPDVISVLNSRGDAEAAAEFVRYVLSPEGQLIWSGKAGLSPTGDALYHYPILPGIFETKKDELLPLENPFKSDFGVKVDLASAQARGRVLVPLVRALTERNHIALQLAARRLYDAGTAAQQRWPSLVAAPISEAQLGEIAERIGNSDSDGLTALVREWSEYFEKRLKSDSQSARGSR